MMNMERFLCNASYLLIAFGIYAISDYRVQILKHVCGLLDLTDNTEAGGADEE